MSPLPVDAQRDRLPHLRVVERRELVVEPHVEHVRVVVDEQLQIGVTLDAGVVARRQVGDEVCVARGQLGDPPGAVFTPAEDQGVERRSLAPVVGVRLEDDLGATCPATFREHERACAHRVLQRGAARRFEMLGWLN